MLIVGEAINTSRKIKKEKVIEAAVISRDADFIRELAQSQYRAGANYIDINAGTLTTGEPEALVWLTQVVQQSVTAPISFDTPNPMALAAALQVYNQANGQPMINSITAESDRYANVLPFVLEYKAKVIALAMDDTGIQQDAGKRLAVACKLVEKLTAASVPVDDIYVDPLTFPIGTGDDVALALLTIVEKIQAEFPGVHTIAGLSNISHGMPMRKLLNQAMVILAMSKGMDAGIIDPNDNYLMGLIAAAEALLGHDEYCMNYITLSREGAFEGI
ncbi:MAG TPA: dihydropteroate synthase [Armatimonadota bacterium]|nr:dihydropteroate synthase [Armatimonadota bacterium]